MGLGLDIGAFLTGVQERSAEYDKDLADRMKTLSEKKDDDTLKTLFADEVAKYEDDKVKIQAIKSAQAAGDWRQAQFLLSGYENIEDYDKAVTLAERQGTTLHFETPTLGKKPIFTKADYGVTNIRDDGSQITTAGRMFDKLFRPDVAKKREGELSGTSTDAEYTTYRRGKTAEAIEGPYSTMPDSKAKVKDMIKNLTSAGYHKDLPDEMEVNSVDEDNNFLSSIQKYQKIPNPSKEYLESKEGKAAELAVGFPGYQKVGDPTFTENTELAQALRDLGPKPEFVSNVHGVINDDDAKVLEEWIFKNNTIRYGYATAHKIERDGRLDIGTIISGVYNKAGEKVSIQYTEKDEDIFMEGTKFAKKGWIQVGGAKIKTPSMGSTIEIYNAAKNTMQKIEYVGGDASFKDHLNIVHKGYERLGDPKEIAVDSVSLQTTYNDKGQEIKVYFTGNPDDNANGDIGWKQIGKAKAATDNWSFKDALQVIDEAILAGTTITEKQYESGRFSFMQGENALAMEMSEALDSYDKFVIMVRDFKFMKVNEITDSYSKGLLGDKGLALEPGGPEYGAAHGKPTGKMIPATAGAIEAIAEAKGKSVREIRLELLERYNARINK